jgi:Holliday junction DNA helicase RuvA
MIASLRGVVEITGVDSAVIDVGGVGYLVFCSSRTLSHLGGPGDRAHVLVVTHVREDHIHLYGFTTAAEREMFGLLTSVQGVGAKVALAILSVLSAEELVQAVLAEDRKPLARANGVGPKLAGRIVAVLKDRVGDLGAQTIMPAITAAAGAAPDAADQAAVSALVNLGFSRVEAFGAVMRASRDLGEGAATDALIKSGLRELAQ